MKNRQGISDIVNELLTTRGSFSSAELAARSATTRQAVHRHLARLVEQGVLVMDGRARATRYRRAPSTSGRFARRYPTTGLQEDAVWREAAAALPELDAAGATNARAIAAYALTEMVNNAIDHSGAAEVAVSAGVDGGRIWFEVDDAGLGAFENVRAGLGLPDHLAALQELSKGKLSTLPDRHSGEGIFFTSKAADHFELAANGLTWLVDNRRADHAIAAAPGRPGTRVRFEVAADGRQPLEELFARYTHDFEFDTTRTVVKLFEYGVRFVSRSEAKRLLHGLERFRHVVLDFTGVEGVGQGFADEVFRVWARAHPTVTLTAESMSPPVRLMIERARSSAEAR